MNLLMNNLNSVSFLHASAALEARRDALYHVCRGCNPVVSYAGARYTSQSCGDTLLFIKGILNRVSHPSQAQAPHPTAADSGNGAASAAKSGNQPSILDSGVLTILGQHQAQAQSPPCRKPLPPPLPPLSAPHVKTRKDIVTTGIATVLHTVKGC